jgi:hypothetical protein
LSTAELITAGLGDVPSAEVERRKGRLTKRIKKMVTIEPLRIATSQTPHASGTSRNVNRE